MEKGEHYFLVHFDEFYTALSSHNTCTLSFYRNMAKKSAESYVSLKGNDKAISIVQNVIKVMVVLKKGRWSIKTWQYLMRHLSFLRTTVCTCIILYYIAFMMSNIPE